MHLFGKRKIRIYNEYEHNIFVRVEDGKRENKRISGAFHLKFLDLVEAGVKVHRERERKLTKQGFVKIRPASKLPFQAKEPIVTIVTTEQVVCDRYETPDGIKNWIVTKDAAIQQLTVKIGK